MGDLHFAQAQLSWAQLKLHLKRFSQAQAKPWIEQISCWVEPKPELSDGDDEICIRDMFEHDWVWSGK